MISLRRSILVQRVYESKDGVDSAPDSIRPARIL